MNDPHARICSLPRVSTLGAHASFGAALREAS